MPYKNIELNPPQYTNSHTIKKSQFYVGYSTQSITTKIYDFDLVKQDIINHFNTRKGERVMNPTFGTIIWDILFEPFTPEIKLAVSDDISKICNSDPRAVPIQININEQDYGLLLEITLLFVATNQTSNMKLTFDKNSGLTTS